MRTERMMMVFFLMALGYSSMSQDVVPDRVREITSRWKVLKNTYTGKTYDVVPLAIPPFRTGKVNQEFLYDGVHYLEFIRMVAGIPSEMELDSALTVQAQHGAVVMAANRELSHTPRKPAGISDDFYKIAKKSASSSNIYYYSAETNLRMVLNSLMDDSDESNISRLGHRRWLLNPELKKVAFGYASALDHACYCTVQVFDKSRKEPFDYDFIAWPARDYCPTMLFGADQAWSITLNPNKYSNNQPAGIVVTLTRKSDKKKWNFSMAKPVAAPGYYNIDTVNYGVPFCIIFRPGDLSEITAGDTFVVEVEGLVDKEGKPAKVSYSTSFFNMD